ncbi:serine/threonine-protein kinase pelle-like [Choristoneura fumiferana]|uniref:serine/threonine-protein kinase pelle-like n=1 Tax=Choristoneura fumiferana TaxID=7141 RepID=UPI003D15DB16
MYIYQLPFEINRELCRFLDHDDIWKDLAGRMNYSAFDVSEVEQTAKRQATSPTSLLLIRWGQLNHRAEELFMLLYRMKHVPAMRCLVPALDAKYQKLLSKKDSCYAEGQKKTAAIEDKVKRHKAATNSESIPLPVMLIEKKGNMPDIQLMPLPASTDGKSPTEDSSSDMSRNASTTGGGVDLNDELLKNVNAIPVISYDDLKEITNNWSPDNLLGKGGFGQVFKGEWKLLPVAVKRLLGNDASNKELIRELCLNQYRHDNILPLYGYSLGGPEACLVYQLMLGESLDHRLRCKTHHPPLSWCQRYRIAQGVARGLTFLHTMTGTPLIHGDIKPANILLDTCLMPKIGDFGLARKGPYGDDRTHLKVSRVHGTRAYLPEEYLRSGLLSPAVDVFSYGVVLAEVATAQHATAKDRAPAPLSQYIQAKAKEGIDLAILEDPKLYGTANSFPWLCREFILLGLNCTRTARSERPTMLEVYKRLDALDVPGKNFV